MSVDAKNQLLAILKNWTATADIVFEHSQSLAINGQRSLTAVFLLLDLSLLNLTSALWAKGVTSAKSLPTFGAGQLQATFEVFDG